MALTLMGSIDNERVRLYFDIVSNRVIGASLVNDHPTRTARVTVDRTQGNRNIEADVAPLTTSTQAFPNNRRFDYDALTADWTYTLGWAD